MQMKYCPVCSRMLIERSIEDKQRLCCLDDQCGFVFWNNPIPVVAGIVEISEGIILCHNKLWPSGIYSIISGFLEPGESPEEGIVREVEEELGLQASDPSFVGVYPFLERNQIILVYHVKAEGNFKLNEEIDSIRQYTREELKGWPFGQEKLEGWPFGAGWAIRDWLQQQLKQV